MTRTLALSVSVALLAIGCGGPQASARESALADLAWLVGTWTTVEDEGRVTTERWEAERDGVMRGHGETREGERITHTEELRIEARADGSVVYVASPSGQATTEFVLAASEGRALEVRNPEHDFPVLIRYERRGDALDAHVEGADGDGFDIQFVRVPD